MTKHLWRLAEPTDDEAVVTMCLRLYIEDPGPVVIDSGRVRRTLDVFRREPHRGRAVVAEWEGRPVGYALLVPFWSNELGGCVCEVDELYVEAQFRSRGIGRALFDAIEAGEIWEDTTVAIALGVTKSNDRARSLYQRVGFRAVGTI